MTETIVCKFVKVQRGPQEFIKETIPENHPTYTKTRSLSAKIITYLMQMLVKKVEKDKDISKSNNKENLIQGKLVDLPQQYEFHTHLCYRAIIIQ